MGSKYYLFQRRILRTGKEVSKTIKYTTASHNIHISDLIEDTKVARERRITANYTYKK